MMCTGMEVGVFMFMVVKFQLVGIGPCRANLRSPGPLLIGIPTLPSRHCTTMIAFLCNR